jgi:hypothetical protein
LSLDEQGVLHTWDADGRPAAPPTPFGKAFWSADGGHLACPAPDGVHIHALVSQPRVQELVYPGQRGQEIQVAWAMQDQLLILSESNQRAQVWRRTPPSGEPVPISPPQDRPITLLAVSKSTTRIASAEDDGKITLWRPATGKLLASYSGHQRLHRRITLLQWSPDETSLASIAQFDREIHLWDAQTGELLIKHRTSGVDPFMAWSPDSWSVASKSERNPVAVEVWDVLSGETRVRYTCSGVVTVLAWSADGTRLAAASGQHIHVFDPRSGKQLMFYPSHQAIITALRWSPDGRLMVSGDSGRERPFLVEGEGFKPPKARVHVWETPRARPAALVPLDRLGVWLRQTKRQLGGWGASIWALLLLAVDFVAIPWALGRFVPAGVLLAVAAVVLLGGALLGGLASREQDLRGALLRVVEVLVWLLWGVGGTLGLASLTLLFGVGVVRGARGALLGVGIGFLAHRGTIKHLSLLP